MAQMVQNVPAMQETWVWSLGWEDPLRRAWQTSPTFLPGESHEQRNLAGYSQWGCRVGHDWVTKHKEQHKGYWILAGMGQYKMTAKYVIVCV